MGESRRATANAPDSVRVTNPQGQGAYVLTCDHAPGGAGPLGAPLRPRL